MKMEIFILGIGLRIFFMVKDNIFSSLVNPTRANSTEVLNKEKESILISTEINFKVCGKMTKNMVMAPIFIIKTKKVMKANGSRGKNLVKELILLLQEINISAYGAKIKNLEKEN